MLAAGAVVNRQFEGWGLLDASYFSATTFTGAGYVDFTPAAAGKLFTVF